MRCGALRRAPERVMALAARHAPGGRRGRGAQAGAAPLLLPASPARSPLDAPPAAGSSAVKVSAKADGKGVSVDVKAGSASARAAYAPNSIRK
jgi:hypothetical protein